jgi:uncharacterized protein
MIATIRAIVVAFAVGLLALGGAQSQGAKPHRIAIQVDQNDPAVMNLALNNAENAMEYYRGKGEDVEIEIVAYGPGLNMLRADTSPVKDRIAQIASAEASFPAKIAFSACNNTLQAMEKHEGHAITIVPQAKLVPAGIVRLTQLEEEGWSYIRP